MGNDEKAGQNNTKWVYWDKSTTKNYTTKADTYVQLSRNNETFVKRLIVLKVEQKAIESDEETLFIKLVEKRKSNRFVKLKSLVNGKGSWSRKARSIVQSRHKSWGNILPKWTFEAIKFFKNSINVIFHLRYTEVQLSNYAVLPILWSEI